MDIVVGIIAIVILFSILLPLLTAISASLAHHQYPHVDWRTVHGRYRGFQRKIYTFTFDYLTKER